MSPLSLRRYRAERLLRHEFERLRGRVLTTVRRRLRASGVGLDHGDLDACYAQAWQGLYMAVLEGQEVENPIGWLVLVTFRRAVEEHRRRIRADRGGELRAGRWGKPHTGTATELETLGAADRDLAAELDDRVQLRQLFEGLRGRLDKREREAATLCYLQGLSRSEAAARMGVTEARMRKLMEGRGRGHPGVAGKVGALVQTISEGGWCEEQGSLMRALAYGVLDPDGERHRLALMHRGQCPGCRAYVASLRGLAAALPPVFLPWGLGASVLGRGGEGAHLAGAAGGGGAGGAVSGVSSGGTGAGLQAGRGLGGALSASGAAGAGGAAGGGWLIGAGPLGAKLAVGCLLALGVGAGCIALNGGHPASVSRHSHPASRSSAGLTARTPTADQLGGDLGASARASLSATAGGRGAPAPLTPARAASREFGPEQALAPSAGRSLASATSRAQTARSSSSRSESSVTLAGSSDSRSSSARVSTSGRGQSAPVSSAAGDSAAAEREFSPG